MLTAVLAFLLGVTSVLAYQGWRRPSAPRPEPRPTPTPTRPKPASPQPARPKKPANRKPTGTASGRRTRAPKDEVNGDPGALVADLGTQLASLGFDPDAEGQPSAAVADYRKAVAAYDGARQLLRRPADGWRDGKIRRVVRAGRLAIDRLDGGRLAQRDGRRGSTPATPHDTAPTRTEAHTETGTETGTEPRTETGTEAPPDTPTADRIRFTGAGRARGKAEFPIERPEPGSRTVVRVVVTRRERMVVRTRTYQGADFRTGDALVEAYGPLDRLALLPAGPTHLLVDCPDPKGWSVELLRVDQVPVLVPGTGGAGMTILCHRGELPLELTFDVSTEYQWRFEFVPFAEGEPSKSGASGHGDSRAAVTVPPRCLVVLTLIDQGTWTLDPRR